MQLGNIVFLGDSSQLICDWISEKLACTTQQKDTFHLYTIAVRIN